MGKQASKTVIGSFVISAIVLFVSGIVIFSGGKFYAEEIKYALFFDHSVTGLSVGAPVVFRGVQIGTVDKIMLLANTDELTVEIPVIIAIEPDRFQLSGKRDFDQDPYTSAKLLIDRGAKAKLGIQSIVTGQLMIEVDFHPEVPPQLTGTDVGFPEIPTMPSDLQQLAQKLKDAPIEEVFDRLMAVIVSLEKVLNAPELKDTLHNLESATANLNQLISSTDKMVGDASGLMKDVNREIGLLSDGLQETVGEARTLLQNVGIEVDRVSDGLQTTIGDAGILLQNVDRQVAPLSNRAQDALVTAQNTLDQASQSLKTYEELVDSRSGLRNDLYTALTEITRAARSLRELTDYLERHPEALIQGKGPGGGY